MGYSVLKDEIFSLPCLYIPTNIIASGKTAGNLCFVNFKNLKIGRKRNRSYL